MYVKGVHGVLSHFGVDYPCMWNTQGWLTPADDHVMLMEVLIVSRYDTDRSGNINAQELHMAFQCSGYNLWVYHDDMGLLPDTWNCGLRMRRECFPRHQLQRKPLVSNPGMHHGTCVTHVPWCMSGSLTCGGRGKRSRHSRRMRNPQFYVSGKRPMETHSTWLAFCERIHQWLVDFPQKMVSDADLWCFLCC